MNDPFLAGAAKRDITPRPGEPLSGFVARDGNSTGNTGPLCVRAVVFRCGEESAAIVQADVLGFATWQVTEVREFAALRLGIPPHAVMLSATHTHAGPALTYIRGGQMAPQDYQWSVIHAIQEAIEEAHAACAPAELALGAVPFEFGINRRQETPEGVRLGVALEKPRPLDLRVARITTKQRQILLHTHACHPYVLPPENLLASGDFPAFAAEDIEQAVNTFALFLNGCGADISPRRAFQGLEAAREEGERVAKAVREASEAATPREVTYLAAAHHLLHIPYDTLPADSEIDLIAGREGNVTHTMRTDIQQRIDRGMQEWSDELHAIVREHKPLIPIHCEIQAIRLGDFTLIGIAGEPFFEIGEQLRTHGQAEIWPLGYTNSFWGYIPTRREIPGGGYEVNESWKYLGIWRPHESAEERVVEAGRKLLTRLTDERRK